MSDYKEVKLILVIVDETNFLDRTRTIIKDYTLNSFLSVDEIETKLSEVLDTFERDN